MKCPKTRYPVFAALALGASASCTGLLGFDDLTLQRADSGADALAHADTDAAAADAAAIDTDTDTAADDVAPDTADAAPDTADAGSCPHAEPPGRPDVVEAGGSRDLVFVTSYADWGFDFDDAGMTRYKQLGFDLDSRCTSWGEAPSCVEPPWAQGVDHTDGVDGVDNGLGALLVRSEPQAVLMLVEAEVTRLGHPALFRVRAYSGQRDDDQVDVALYVGLELVGDASDTYAIHPDTVLNGDVNQPRFHDDAAYVTGGILVAHMPEILVGPGKIPVAPDRLDHLVQFVLAAELVPDDAGGWTLANGVWGARVPIKDALTSFGYNESDNHAGQPKCLYKDEFDMGRATVCSNVDISAGPDDPSSPCDALSFGGAFAAMQAKLGDVGQVQAPPTCLDGLDYSCDSLADQ